MKKDPRLEVHTSDLGFSFCVRDGSKSMIARTRYYFTQTTLLIGHFRHGSSIRSLREQHTDNNYQMRQTLSTNLNILDSTDEIKRVIDAQKASAMRHLTRSQRTGMRDGSHREPMT